MSSINYERFKKQNALNKDIPNAKKGYLLSHHSKSQLSTYSSIPKSDGSFMVDTRVLVNDVMTGKLHLLDCFRISKWVGWTNGTDIDHYPEEYFTHPEWFRVDISSEPSHLMFDLRGNYPEGIPRK